MKARIPFGCLFVTVLALTCPGCLEHTFTITVLPGERVRVDYLAKGDRIDLSDTLWLMPDSARWNLRWSVEQLEDQTVHIVEGSLLLDHISLLRDAFDWKRSERDTVQLRKQVSIDKNPMLFGSSWRFSGTTFSRGFIQKYGDIWDFVPEECRVLEDDSKLDTYTADETMLLEEKFALGVLQWNRERYLRRFDRVLEMVKQRIPGLEDTTAVTCSISRAGWTEDLHRYMNNLDIPEPTVVNLEWWGDLRPLFLGRMFDLTGPDSINLVVRMADDCEREYQISKDLEDDLIRFRVYLPGKVLKTNGEKGDDGSLVWEFGGKELLNNDGVMAASTFEVSWWRVSLFGFLVVLAIILIRRRHRASSAERSNEPGR